MTDEAQIIKFDPQAGHEWQAWWPQAPGRYLLGWEQARLDALVNDLFGFHALQLGLAELDGLRANRMPHRWLASAPPVAPAAFTSVAHAPVAANLTTLGDDAPRALALRCQPEALPFPDQSLDLVLLPHTLELAADPHDSLREVERVLRPEGRLIILGFNPHSLWGLRQTAAHARAALGLRGRLYLPRSGEFIAPKRVRDWLRLLSFELEVAEFGCWRPPLRRDAWLQRWSWADAVGARALPGLGAVYLMQAVKRVRGMRLVGLARRTAPAPAGAPAVVANRQRRDMPAAARRQEQAGEESWK